MTGAIESFVYISKAKIPFSHSDLRRLAKTCASQNKLYGITRFLYYNSGYFIQYFEGSSVAVQQLRINVQRDSRHIARLWLNDREKKERRFASWSMQNLNDILSIRNEANTTAVVIYDILLLSLQKLANKKLLLDGATQRFIFNKVDFLSNMLSDFKSCTSKPTAQRPI